MRFIEEVVVDEFLPTFRSMLAADLRDRGLTQHEVAQALGISQSAVSKYAHGDIPRRATFEEDERVQETVDRLGAGLATDSMSTVQALIEAEILIRRLSRPGDRIAALHEELVPELREYDYDFRAEEYDSEVLTRERVRSSVKRGLRILEHASGFATLIPAVGSNLVECLPDADSVEDVAGVPGRIFDVKGRTEIPAEPEFGVSEHVASVLLAARAGGSTARAALNVGYDASIVETLESTGHEAVAFDVDTEPAPEAVERAVASNPEASVVYQTGGFGVEPIVYVLGESASEVAGIARDLR
ncbi:putative transcriptional regulator fused phosphomethylpyrimidine kinase, involved in the thiamine biosynthesis [Halanaeroarchaeum sp. HSR-CO]|uniref:thiamine-phosphate synthase family protein n=1 Tax=Halanaeroarchaeum sp. HSR-CO TaxID=2866382 RepID=UPI00217E69AD|nr:thiamine-phosphate synthase family protein [Halanaeroarchaeum sp. HSR-CO]UWG47206.1 putative transcriptional regulator fused phosphomethylpyrimidine kinase, involved in the thiamine biosynthesis [Halanaeroarchaeum sp. HSR-CO]